MFGATPLQLARQRSTVPAMINETHAAEHGGRTASATAYVSRLALGSGAAGRRSTVSLQRRCNGLGDAHSLASPPQGRHKFVQTHSRGGASQPWRRRLQRPELAHCDEGMDRRHVQPVRKCPGLGGLPPGQADKATAGQQHWIAHPSELLSLGRSSRGTMIRRGPDAADADHFASALMERSSSIHVTSRQRSARSGPLAFACSHA